MFSTFPSNGSTVAENARCSAPVISAPLLVPVRFTFPIGLMFAILGVLLAGFGLVSDKTIYERSLGINVNLIWGTILIVFSVILLWLGSRKGYRD